MYPIVNIELSYKIPDAHVFWTPTPSEITDEGLGYFRDVFDLRGVTVNEASEILSENLRVFDFIASKATTFEEFDTFASAFEYGSAEDEGLIGAIGAEIDAYIESTDCYLGGLELGVGAVAYALSAAKMFPAASCRSHSGSRSWSPYPVVYFAASQQHSALLEQFVVESGCGFLQDLERPELLVIGSDSIPRMLHLAKMILESLK